MKGEYISIKTARIMADIEKENKELQKRIDEAIEYIKGWQSFPHTNGSTHNELRNLLIILQGGDKE